MLYTSKYNRTNKHKYAPLWASALDTTPARARQDVDAPDAWSKRQQSVALSSVEAEYMALL